MKSAQPLQHAFTLATICLLALAANSLLAHNVTATEDSFYKAWQYPGDTFTVDNTLYTVQEGSDPYQVLLEKEDGERYVIEYKDCSLNANATERYCFEESDYADCDYGAYECPEKCYDPDKTDCEPEGWCCPYDVSHIRYEAGKVYWGAYLQFYNRRPDVTVKRAATTTTLELDEPVTITLTLENTGAEAIVGALYQERVPANFTVSSSDFTIHDRALTATVTVNPGAQKILKYSLTPKAYTQGSVQGNLSYEYKGDSSLIKTGSLTLKVPSPYTITNSLSASSVEPTETVTYTYTVKNNDGANAADTTINFDINPDVVDEKPNGVTLTNGRYKWSKELSPGASKTLAFTLASKVTGRFTINASAKVDFPTETFTDQRTNAFTTTLATPKASIQLSKTTANAGEPYTLRVLVENTNDEVAFEDVVVTLRSNHNGVPPRTYHVPILGTNEEKVVAELPLTTPTATEKLNLQFTVEGAARTPYDESFPLAATAQLAVAPVAASTPFTITQTVSNREAVPGDSIEVTVSVQSKTDEYRGVTVAEEFSTGAIVKAGNTKTELSLDPGEERQAYEYKVTIPEDYDEETFLITTRVVDELDESEYNTSTTVFVTTPDVAEEEVDAGAESNVVDGSTNEAVVEEKRSFFRKIIDWFVGVFS